MTRNCEKCKHKRRSYHDVVGEQVCHCAKTECEFEPTEESEEASDRE